MKTSEKPEPIPIPVLQRGRAKSLWSRPEVKRARRRAEARREPFSPRTQIHELCSRSQPKEVLKSVVASLFRNFRGPPFVQGAKSFNHLGMLLGQILGFTQVRR